MKRFLMLLTCMALSAPSVFAVQMSGDVKSKYHLDWNEENDIDHWVKTEANIRMDHTFDRGWAVVNIRGWAKDMTTTQGIALDKAYMGFMVHSDTQKIVTIEVGKNRLEDMFDSKVQYNAHFSGLHASLDYFLPNAQQLVVHGGPFVISAADQTFGFVGEAVLAPSPSIPLTAKYSLTRWDKQFLISQFTVQYQFLKGLSYAAILVNHHSSDIGFYVGYKFGQLRKAHDWQLDVCFQFMDKPIAPTLDRKGVNKGFELKSSYAFTDHLSLEVKDLLDVKTEENRLSVGAIYTW